MFDTVDFANEFVGTCGVVNLVIGVGVVSAIALDLFSDERMFIEIFPFFLVLIDP